MGCKVLCPSVVLLAYLMLCQHVQGQCTEPIFQANNVMLVNHLTSFPDGSTVTFECMIGYKPVVSKAPKSVTCQGNKWTDLKLTCTKKSCGSLKDITNGRYEMTGNLFGDTAKPVCNDGHVLSGQETTRTCRDGGWDGRDPECDPVQCQAPPPLVNGNLGDTPEESYQYSQAVSYRCNEGYTLVGQSILHCSEDGTFKPDLPKCFGPYKLNNYIQYKCKDGCTINNTDNIVCRENGWDPELPKCIENCKSPVLSDKLTLTQDFKLMKSFSHGSQVTVKCKDGYTSADKTSPSQSITCEETKWTKVTLTCIALPTPSPTVPSTTKTPTTAAARPTSTVNVPSTTKTPTTAAARPTSTVSPRENEGGGREEQEASPSNTALVIGCLCGAIVLCIVVGLLIWLYKKYSKHQYSGTVAEEKSL